MKTKSKQLQAIELMRYEPARALHIEYKGEAFSGIRIAKRSRGEPTELELSSFTGTVGDIRERFVRIQPNESVSVPA